jgi:hypothetical protein
MDKITCFSNSSSFVSVLAPGAAITAANITMTGTSQASPHVAGALAVLRSAFPSEALNATVARVTDTGPQIKDPRNGVVKRRLDLKAALGLAGGGSGGGATLPTGSVTIQAGANAVKTGTVTLAITASDGVTKMCVSNTASCSSFIAFAPTKTWVLASGDGTKTVYVSLKDAAGNVTKVSDTIVRDAKLPVNPVLTATAGNTKIDLSWTEGSDAASGIASYKVVFTTGAAAPSNCNAGMVVYSGTSRTASQTSLVNGLQYSYRVCAIDAAGNMSTGATASARPAPELEAPTGTVVISGGAQYAKSTSVTLALSATDASGVTSMCISNTTKCTSWVAYTTTKTWTLSTNGTVYVWFRDAWGNVSTMPATDTIVVDKTVPTMGSFFQALAGQGRVDLAWSAATDAASGVSAYKLVWAKSTTAPSCAKGMTAYSGSDTAYAPCRRASRAP